MPTVDDMVESRSRHRHSVDNAFLRNKQLASPNQTKTEPEPQLDFRSQFFKNGPKRIPTDEAMEQATKRVGPPTSKRRNLARAARTSLPVSSSSPRGAPRKEKREKKHTSEEFWEARAILEERRKNGNLEYLVDWEDNIVTGESYAPEWTNSKDCTAALIGEWQRRKKTRVVEVQSSGAQHSSSILRSQETEATGPEVIRQSAKRRRIDEDSDLSSEEHRPQGKQRKARTVQTASSQSIPQETAELEEAPIEIKDSYEEVQPWRAVASPNIHVEIPPLTEGFDKTAYTRIPSSQLTETADKLARSSSGHETFVHEPAPSPKVSQKPRPQRPFIWDEDSSVPDSQEPNSSSYLPADTQASQQEEFQEPSTGRSTGEETQFPNFNETLSSAVTSSIRSSTGQLFGHLSYHPRPYNTFESSSVRTREGSLREQGSERSKEESELRSSQESNSLEQVADVAAQSLAPHSEPLNSGISVENSIVIPSKPSPASILSLDPSSKGATALETYAQHRQPSQGESINASELQFQTQLPLIGDSSSGDGSQQLVDDLDRYTQFSHPTVSHAQSQTATAQRSSEISGCGELNGYHSPSPHPPPDSSRESLEARTVSTPSQPSAQRFSADTGGSSNKILSELNLNTQRSQTVSQDKVPIWEEAADSQAHSELGRLSVSHENIRRSIEGTSGETFHLPKPSPPSSSQQLPESYESNLHKRPSTSSIKMEDQDTGDLKAYVELRRAEAAAKRKAARLAEVYLSESSPSSQAQQSSVASQLATARSNSSLPVRESPLKVSPILAPSSISAPESPQPDYIGRNLRVPSMGPDEYMIALPLTATTRSIYCRAMTQNSREQQIREFISSDVYDEQLNHDMDDMLSDLELICDHSDLSASDFSTQKEYPDVIQARWAENISTKCIFVAEFLAAVRDQDFHVAIVARPGRMIEILQALLRSHNYTYTGPGPDDLHYGTGGVWCTLLLGAVDEQDPGDTPATAVVAFDSAYKDGMAVKALRVDASNPGKLAPFVSLVTTHSVEHVNLCLNDIHNPFDQKRMLVSCLSDIGEDVGKLGHEYPSPPDAAASVASFLRSENVDGTWPLPKMPDIEGITLASGPVASPRIDETQLSGSKTQSYALSQISHSLLASKRHLAIDDSTVVESSKRQRLTPAPGESENTTIHVSETNNNSSQDKAMSNVAEAQKIIDKVNAVDDEQDGQLASLMKKILDLEKQVQEKESVEAELRQRNETLEARCTDLQTSIARTQPRYQEALNERGKFEHDAERLTTRISVLQRNLEARTAELTKLREDKAAVDVELATARTALSTSAVPEIASFHKFEEENRNIVAENIRLQKRLTALQSDIDYARTSWQQANSAAALSAQEVTALETEISALKKKADENSVRIHQINMGSQSEALVNRIDSLEVENEGLRKELEKRSEELRVLQSGRRATRGTSVPRSPRMGGNGGTAGMSPRGIGVGVGVGVGVGGSVGRVLGMGGSRGNSRGNSPAPGAGGNGAGVGIGSGTGVDGPLRGTFPTEALFQGPRWGNHLQ